MVRGIGGCVMELARLYSGVGARAEVVCVLCLNIQVLKHR